MNWVDDLKSEIERYLSVYDDVMRRYTDFLECINGLFSKASVVFNKRQEMIDRALSFFDAKTERSQYAKLMSQKNDVEACNIFNYSDEREQKEILDYISTLEDIAIMEQVFNAFHTYKGLFQVLAVIPDHPTFYSKMDTSFDIDSNEGFSRFDISDKYSILCRQTFGRLVYDTTGIFNEIIYERLDIPGLYNEWSKYRLFMGLSDSLEKKFLKNNGTVIHLFNRQFLQELLNDLNKTEFTSAPDVSIHVCKKIGITVPSELIKYKELYEEPYELIQIRDQRALMERASREQIDAINENAERDRISREKIESERRRTEELQYERNRAAQEEISEKLLAEQRKANRLSEQAAFEERHRQEEQKRANDTARSRALATCHNCKNYTGCKRQGDINCGSFVSKY